MTYRTVLLITAIATGVAVKAQAQDGWEGFYGGISITKPQTKANVGANTTHRYKSKSKEVLLGIYGGYNFVNSSGFVWGPEIGLTGLNNKGSKTDVALGTSRFDGKYLLTPRLRAGWATDRFYFYGAAGVGISDIGVRPAGSSKKNVHVVPAFGLGVEMMVRDGWSARIDAMSYDFSGGAQTFNGSPQKVKTKLRTISIGLSRKF